MKPHRSISIFVFFLLFLFLGFRYGQAQNFPPNTTVYAIAKSGLNIRNKPVLEGSKVGRIPFGERLELLETVLEAKDQFEGISGYWVKVQYDSISGYVFDGFLSRIPVIDSSVPIESQNCLGPLLREYVRMNYTFVDSVEYTHFGDEDSDFDWVVYELDGGHSFSIARDEDYYMGDLTLNVVLEREGEYLVKSLVDACGLQQRDYKKFRIWAKPNCGESLEVLYFNKESGEYNFIVKWRQ